MTKGILLTIIILLTSISIIDNRKTISICLDNPIYCQIVRNNKTIDRTYAMKLSNVIYHTARLYNIDPIKYTAILGQESMYKLNSVNKHSKDYGIAQINHKTAKAYKFDLKRLTTDLVYSVNAGAIVLSDMQKRHGHKEQQFWSRYNSSNKLKRKQYAKLVMRYM